MTRPQRSEVIAVVGGRYGGAFVSTSSDRLVVARRPGHLVGRRVRVVLAAVALALAALVLAMGPSSPASAGPARPAQDPATVVSTTAPVTATAGATTATTAVTESTTSSTRVIDENRRVWAVVAALIIVALLLLVLTIVYWRHTDPGRYRPSKAAERPLPIDDDEVLVPTADELAASDAEEGEGDADDAVLVPGTEEASAELRAVEGPTGVGAGWEPRATGELPRIAPTPAARSTRPTRAQRALVLGIAVAEPPAEPAADAEPADAG